MDNDGLIKMMVASASHTETIKAEAGAPQPAITMRDQTKRQLIKMLTESTRCNILDSGGAYGRGWQRNREVTDWDARPAVTLEVCDGEFILSKDVYHFLSDHLSITPDSREEQRRFKAFQRAQPDSCDYDDMEDFIKLRHNGDYPETAYTANTYNGEDALSQVLQYGIYVHDKNPFIILQIHNGCDVRGGYTSPYVFELKGDFDEFEGDRNGYKAACTCSAYWSDDAGYHFYNQNSGVLEPELAICFSNLKFNTKDNKLTCKKCGHVLEFSG